MIDRQRFLFVGGKGGVGKTTTAAALAVSLAEHGERCLLTSTDPAHSLGDLFDRRIGDRETALLAGLDGLEIDPEAEADRYLASVKRTLREFVQPAMYHEIDRQMALTRLAPGTVEAALLERVAELMITTGADYDRVVFDTAPTGQTLRLLSLPEIMAAWTDGLLRHRQRSDTFGRALEHMRARGAGDDLAFVEQRADNAEDERSRRIRDVLLARRRKFHQARRILLDTDTSAFLLVLIPEKLPILETHKALEALDRFDVPVAGIVVNRVLPREPLGEFLERRRRQEAEYLERIEGLFARLPRVQVPLLPRDVDGHESLREVARWLLPHSSVPRVNTYADP